jgi:pimeloyl-ACP methyl ester carboxylesterase
VKLGLFENPRFQPPAPEAPSLAVGTLPRERVQLPCGEVSYLRHGSGPPLLLVHGVPTSARLWEPLLGDLGERYDCIVPDLLGLGRSRAAPTADVASPGQAAMLAELLDALGVDETLAVFHDQGGAHGMRFLERHGERVRAVAFCDVVCYDNWLVPAIAALVQLCRFPALLHGLTRTGVIDALFLRAWPFPQTVVRAPLPAALVDDWFAALRAGGPDLLAWCDYIRAQSPRHTLETVPTLRSWGKPALVVWAGHDRYLSPSWGVRLAQEIPGAPDQPVLLPFAGHFFHADVPRTAARVLLDFFDALPQP